MRPRIAVFLVVVFVASRGLCWFAGLRFDPFFLYLGMQMLDPELLRSELFSSLLHLHSNPPLLNLAAGLFLKGFGSAHLVAWQATFHALGLATAIALFAGVRAVGGSERMGTAFAVLHMLSPAAILYEFWFSYTHVVVFLLALAVPALHRFFRSPTIGAGVFFFSVLAAICLTRSFFHLLWFGASVAGAIAMFPERFHRVLWCAAVPAAAVVAWSVKNFVLFGSFAASSFGGISLAQVAVGPLPVEERRALIDAGRLHPIAALSPALPTGRYAEFVKSDSRFQGIDVLKRRKKTPPPDFGSPLYRAFPLYAGLKDYAELGSERFLPDNYNHIEMLQVSKAFGVAARQAMREDPGAYLRGIGKAVGKFFVPSSEYETLRDNRARLGVYNEMVRRFPLLVVGSGARFGKLGAIAWGTVLVWGSLLFVGGRILRRLGSGAFSRDSAGGVVLFCAGTAGYIFLVSSLFELGENMRYGFQAAPLIWVLIAASANHVYGARGQ